MKQTRITLLLLWSVVLITTASCSRNNADFVLMNGNIFTSDTAQLYAQAVAIKGNKIMAVGTNEEIEKFVSNETKRIDLKGKTVVPGFNNAHDHLGWFAPIGKRYSYWDFLSDGLDKTAVLDSVSRLVQLAKPNQWISGFIGNKILNDGSVRHALDSIAPNHPVVLFIWWGHGMVANTRALELAGLSDELTDPIGGWYERTDESGRITAIHQNAQLPLWNAWLISEPDVLVKDIQTYAQEELRGGITTLQQMSSTLNGSESVRIFKEADLPIRLRVIAWPHSTSQERKLREWDLTDQQPSALTYFSGIKYTIDGTPLEGNALRTKPYPGRPDWYGRLNYPVDTMRQIFKEALTSNRQLMMHITADSSFSVVLSMMQEAGTGEQWRSKRVRIEHNCVGIVSQDQRKVLKDLGIIMMHTPKFCMGGSLRSMLDDGIVVGIAPDGTTNPFFDIMMLTTGAEIPGENLTREQAVIAFTRTNAYAEFKETEKGTLMPGMLADLAVLSQDIFTIPADQLPATKSQLTMVDGKIVYENVELK